MSEKEPEWFTEYVKTHDQDHQELEKKLENKQDLYPLHKGVQDIPLMNIISELEQKIDALEQWKKAATVEGFYFHSGKQGEKIKELEQNLQDHFHAINKEQIEREYLKSVLKKWGLMD